MHLGRVLPVQVVGAFAVLAANGQSEVLPDPDAVQLYCTAPYGVVAAGTSPQMVLTNAPAGTLSWKLSSDEGRTVSSGTWEAGSELRLPPLSAGYYRLEAAYADGRKLRETSLCALEPLTEKLPHDSPIGLMTALTYQAHPQDCFSPWNGGDLLANYLTLLGWLGVSNVREISQWYGEAAPAPGDFRRQPETPQGRERALRLLAQAGVKPVLFNDQAYPGWVERDGRVGGRAFPRDLKYVYDYAKFMAGEYGDWVFANEFSNEAICSSSEPAWDYAACQKAAYLGFKDARPDVPAVHGAFCLRMTEPFYASLADNGFFDYTDAFNDHTYGSYKGYPREFQEIRDLLARAGADGRQIWMTEFCTDEEGTSDIPSVNRGFGKNYKAMSREQERIVADFYAKAQIGLMMQGVALAHWFVLPCYNERGGAKDWGLVRRDGTVKPVFWEFAQFVRKVGRAKLEGEVRRAEGQHAFLFTQPDGSQTAVGWSDQNPRVRYADGLRGLKADVPPRPVGKLGVPPAGADEDRRVIVQLLVRDGEGDFQEKRSSLILKDEAMRVNVRVWNLDGAPKRGRLDVRGGTLADVPESVEIPGWGKASFDATFAPAGFRSALEVRFVTEDGRKSTPAHVDLVSFKGLCRDSAPLSVPESNRADMWRRNTNAETWTCVDDPDAQAVRMESSWRPGLRDRWTAPVLDLSSYTGRLDRATLLEYEIRARQDKVENDFNDYVIMLVYGDVRRELRIHPPAPTAEWTKVYAPLPEGAGRDLKALRIACCPKGNKLTMSIRNLRFYVEK